MTKIKNPILRITFDAMCLALYIVLSSFCPETLFFKITFDSVPLLIAAIIGGPIDGILIAICGCVVNDAITGYLNFMTPVWMIPAVVRAAIVGFIFYKKEILEHKVLWIFTVILSGLLVTAINTGVMFLDGYIFEYPVTLTWLATILRVSASIIVSIINIFLIPLLVEALKKARLITQD